MMNKILQRTFLDKNYQSLQKELINILQEQFNLRIQFKAGQLKQLHLLKKIRVRIAFIKYCLSKNEST